MMYAIVGAEITICRNDSSAFDWNKVCGFFGEKLSWDNPEYQKKMQMHKWTGNTPKKIILYKNIGNDKIVVPFGELRTVHAMGIQLKRDPSLSLKDAGNYFQKAEGLYDYQQNAVDAAIQKRNGVIIAPCGAGKTQIALGIISTIRRHTLWITHTKDLMMQSMERCHNFLGVNYSDMGKITDGKIDVKDGITFATVQTLSRVDLKNLYSFWDVVIVDECHHATGTPTQLSMFWKVLSQISARFKIGLTATPKRKNDMQKSMFSLFGSIITEIPKEAVKEKLCPVNVEFTETGWTPDFETVLNGDGTLSYCKLISECTNNESRNNLIVSEICSKMKARTLVLSERVEHLSTLSQLMHNMGITCEVLSTAKRSERNNIISDFKEDKFDVLLGTYQLAKEGLDIPTLEHLVMASPVKDETAVVQSAGRVARKAEGKEFGTVHDFVDNMPMLVSWANKRKKFYKKINSLEE